MAITATLVEAKANRLRYLIDVDVTAGDQTVNITSSGAASPDLQTDSKYGPLKALSRAAQDGLGKLAAGALTQAESRAIWLADSADTVLGVKVPRAHCRISASLGRAGTARWKVDANVAAGVPEIQVTATQPGAAAAEGTAYLDVFYPGAIGL